VHIFPNKISKKYFLVYIIMSINNINLYGGFINRQLYEQIQPPPSPNIYTEKAGLTKNTIGIDEYICIFTKLKIKNEEYEKKYDLIIRNMPTYYENYKTPTNRDNVLRKIFLKNLKYIDNNLYNEIMCMIDKHKNSVETEISIILPSVRTILKTTSNNEILDTVIENDVKLNNLCKLPQLKKLMEIISTINKQFADAAYLTNSYENLGYVDLYRRSSSTGSYDLAHSFVSPNPTQGERFGSKMVMAQTGSEYVLAVTSPGTDTESVDSTVVQGRVYMYRYGTGAGDDSSVRWQMDYDRNYQGAFDSSRSYLQGDIVFYDYNLYECVGNTDFQNPAPDQSSLWSSVTTANILGYFPQESSLFDVNNNDLTLAALEGQTIESVQPGDKFGAAIDLSSDGQTLIISAPGADQDTYENYKGPFRTSLKYFEDDVVYYNGYYYKFN
jgi:hypothetical protein